MFMAQLSLLRARIYFQLVDLAPVMCAVLVVVLEFLIRKDLDDYEFKMYFISTQYLFHCCYQ